MSEVPLYIVEFGNGHAIDHFCRIAYRVTSLVRNHPPWDPTVALCLETYGDPRGRGISYERGAPVIFSAGNSLADIGGSRDGPARGLNCRSFALTRAGDVAFSTIT